MINYCVKSYLLVLLYKQTDTSTELDYSEQQPFYGSQGHQLPQIFYQTAMNLYHFVYC